MEKQLTALTITEQKQQVHDCLKKLVEIKLILQNIADLDYPKKSVWQTNEVGESWCDLRTNVASIYIDFLEMEVNHV